MSEIDHLKPKNAINLRYYDQYEKKQGVLYDDLVHLHSNLKLVSQFADFDGEFFDAPRHLFSYLTQLLMTECALICTRIWKDKGRGRLTLDKFAKWLRSSAILPVYRQALEKRLDAEYPGSAIEKTIEDLRGIRHARVAHLDPDVIMEYSQPPIVVSFDEVKSVADSLGAFYNATNFNRASSFVFIEFHPISGYWFDGELGNLLDRVALTSRWFRDSGENEGYWKFIIKDITHEQRTKINEVRMRHNMPPLEE